MIHPTVNIFTLHSRQWQENRYVYPVVSRRSKGLSIGVNLNPDKICNFDCVYCSVDRTQMPERAEVDLAILEAELRHMVGLASSGEIWRQPPFDRTPAALRRINDIAFSGDGEPTSFQRFQDAAELAVSVLTDANAADVKIVVITNATLFHQDRVLETIRYLDHHNGEIWAKLDAGTEAYYKLVERTTIPLQRVLDNLLMVGRDRPIVIQSLFMRISDVPPSGEEIAAYVGRLQALRDGGGGIKLVQVYTVARTTAEAYVTPLRNEEVDAIVNAVREAGIHVEGYYGPD
ncbi:MAG: radical SAM protein [Burkholderiales bacterium]|nr:radical SAM protein [Phycisphaerae bacterium]